MGSDNYVEQMFRSHWNIWRDFYGISSFRKWCHVSACTSKDKENNSKFLGDMSKRLEKVVSSNLKNTAPLGPNHCWTTENSRYLKSPLKNHPMSAVLPAHSTYIVHLSRNAYTFATLELKALYKSNVKFWPPHFKLFWHSFSAKTEKSAAFVF